MDLKQKIKDKVKCPQFGYDTYGEWGALPLECRKEIYKLCELYEGCEQEIELLKKELIKECEEHKQAMLYADKQINELKTALEMACKMLSKNSHKEISEWFDSTRLTAKDIENYLRMKARKELDNVS